MKLFLSSSGHTVADYLKTQQLENSPIAYITTASLGKHLDGTPINMEYIIRERERFDKVGIKYDEYDLLGYTKSQLLRTLKNYRYVYVTGGNTYYLLRIFRDTGFNKILTELVKNGTVYLGSSAGSYIAGPTIEPATWSFPQRHFRYGIKDLSALNLVPFLIKAHYTEAKKDAICKGIATTTYKTYVLNDEQAILFDDGKISVWGDSTIIDLKC